MSSPGLRAHAWSQAGQSSRSSVGPSARACEARSAAQCVSARQQHCTVGASPAGAAKGDSACRRMSSAQRCVSCARRQQRCQSCALQTPGQPAQKKVREGIVKQQAVLHIPHTAVVMSDAHSCVAVERPPAHFAEQVLTQPPPMLSKETGLHCSAGCRCSAWGVTGAPAGPR